MPNHLQITYRGIVPSPAVSQEITERATKLPHFHPRLISCQIVVTAPPKRTQRKQQLYSVRIAVKVPRRTLIVTRKPTAEHAPADIYVTLHEAFAAMERRLEDIVRRDRDSERTAA